MMTTRALTVHRMFRLALPLVGLPVLVACGGGAADAVQAVSASSASSASPADEATQAFATATPAVGALELASSTAGGQARGGDICSTSADGSRVLFSSTSDTVVSGDNNANAADLFLKNLRTGAVVRVSTTSTGGPLLRASSCLGMTPDGRAVALQTETGGSGPYITPVVAAESAIFVKNLATGALVRATPPLASVPTTRAFRFAGISNDGLRVAYIALPTTRYLGGYETAANGPARLMVSDLSNPAAVRFISLEAQAPFTVPQGSLYGDALLSPDGKLVAFSSQADQPALGDNNGKSDLFTVNVDTLAVRQINTDISGNVITGGTALFGPTYGLQGYFRQGGNVAFAIGGDSSAGPAGIYAKDLASGALRLLWATAGIRISGDGIRLDVTISEAGTSAAYVRRSGSSQGSDVPVLRNLTTGQERNAATTAAGTASNGRVTTAAVLSADGSTVAFANNGSNLVGSNRNFELRVYAKRVAAPGAVQ